MAKTIFEEMGGKYERQGDYLIPCLTVPAEEEQPIGIWGQRHLDYLKHHCKVTEVREHNSFAQRVPVIEEQIKVINHRIQDLEHEKER